MYQLYCTYTFLTTQDLPHTHARKLHQALRSGVHALQRLGARAHGGLEGTTYLHDRWVRAGPGRAEPTGGEPLTFLGTGRGKLLTESGILITPGLNVNENEKQITYVVCLIWGLIWAYWLGVELATP